ncbi:FAD-dependent oxidoreductase [Pantoea ananatis]|uniref:FAD-dependent oxidoreductase n=1 Tax=Pantoea ananas TaxID=553 RepID=UPI003CF9C38A
MKIAIIGAGPAGLISARNAIRRGAKVTLYEKLARVGGIWNPDSGGAYRNARMQNSRDTFHYSCLPGQSSDIFLGVEQVGSYLSEMAVSEGVMQSTRLNTLITKLKKTDEGWSVTSITEGHHTKTEVFDKVIITTGELWQPRIPKISGMEHFRGKVITSKDYRVPDAFQGKNVLVIGGGVSGADIASDLVPYAQSVTLSVKKMGLYLPREFVSGPNDMMHSYVGRYLLSQMSYTSFLEYLDNALPEYMKLYRSSGMLPARANNNAIHVNEKIIPNIVSGLIKVKPQAERILSDGCTEFVDATLGEYDAVISCAGYEMPDYSFIEGFDRTQLYEHFFWTQDPSLTIINPPVDTAGFGAAFPYFDIISQWVLGFYEGKIALPAKAAMEEWCAVNMKNLQVRRFYDSWLETIRIGLRAGILPAPSEEFSKYWNLVSSVVRPGYLSASPDQPEHGIMDDRFDFETTRLRVLASMNRESLLHLLNKGEISQADCQAAMDINEEDKIAVTLPYSQIYL